MNEYFLAFDIGGTTVKYGLVNQELEISEHWYYPTPENSKDGIVLSMVHVWKKLRDRYDIVGIGVSTAGIVSSEGTIDYASPTIPNYVGTEVRKMLEEHTAFPVAVLNDVDAALLGECSKGAALGIDSVYCLTLGTGIGGAYYCDGQLVHGAHSQANAIGYLPATENLNFEQAASTTNLAKGLINQGLEIKQVFELARKNDPRCQRLLGLWANQVAKGLVAIILIHDPKMIIIGGSIAQQGDFLENLLTEAVLNNLPAGFLKTNIRVSSLANDAQLIGATMAIMAHQGTKMEDVTIEE